MRRLHHPGPESSEGWTERDTSRSVVAHHTGAERDREGVRGGVVLRTSGPHSVRLRQRVKETPFQSLSVPLGRSGMWCSWSLAASALPGPRTTSPCPLPLRLRVPSSPGPTHRSCVGHPSPGRALTATRGRSAHQCGPAEVALSSRRPRSGPGDPLLPALGPPRRLVPGHALPGPALGPTGSHGSRSMAGVATGVAGRRPAARGSTSRCQRGLSGGT
jgi:hypothetical protein